MNLGLQIAIQFVDKAKQFYMDIFKKFDTKKKMELSFEEFEKSIKYLDHLRPQW